MPNNAQIKLRHDLRAFLETHIGHTMVAKIKDRKTIGKVIRISDDFNSMESPNYIGPKIWLNTGDKFLHDFFFEEIWDCSCQVTFKEFLESQK